MRTVVVVILAAAAGLVLQSTAFHVVPGIVVVPDVLLVLCVYLGLRQHSVMGALGAFVLGYVQDSFSGTAVGLNAFGMCLVFLLVYLTSRRLWVDNLMSKVVVVFMASMVKIAAVTALLLLFVSPGPLTGAVATSLLSQALVTAALGPLIFSLVMGAERPQQEEWS